MHWVPIFASSVGTSNSCPSFYLICFARAANAASLTKINSPGVLLASLMYVSCFVKKNYYKTSTWMNF